MSDRLIRKREIARRKLTELEDELSGNELLLDRLEALPAELQDDDVKAALDRAHQQIAILNIGIAAMEKAGGPSPPPENRAQRRAKAKADRAGALNGEPRK